MHICASHKPPTSAVPSGDQWSRSGARDTGVVGLTWSSMPAGRYSPPGKRAVLASACLCLRWCFILNRVRATRTASVSCLQARPASEAGEHLSSDPIEHEELRRAAGRFSRLAP